MSKAFLARVILQVHAVCKDRNMFARPPAVKHALRLRREVDIRMTPYTRPEVKDPPEIKPPVKRVQWAEGRNAVPSGISAESR